jgi:AcrR family transcriptional regulator
MGTKPAYHHGRLREALIDEAERIIARRGLDAVTLREVARGARVTHAAPYHHFRKKDDLLAAVAERGFDALTARMLAARGRNARVRLQAICEAYVAFAIERPARFRVMFGRSLAAKKKAYPGLRAAAERCFRVLLDATVMATSAREGLDLAIAGWSLAHGLSHLAIEGVLEGLPMKPKGKRLPYRLAGLLLSPRR